MASRLLPVERRVLVGTAAAYSLRALGLNLTLPVLATWAAGLPGATSAKVGVCVGAYGLSQAILQLPFGALSDRFGRRVVISISLVTFAAGSALTASASDIEGAILGRLLQGAGAIASAVIALAADATRPEARARGMAVIGVALGGAFAAGFPLGPVIAHRIGVPSLFFLACGLSLAGALLFQLAVPAKILPRVIPPAPSMPPRSGARSRWTGVARLARDPGLLRANGGIAVLHASLTGIFVAVPLHLRDRMAEEATWRVYAPAIVSGIVAMAIAVRRAEEPSRIPSILRSGGLAAAAGLAGIAAAGGNTLLLAIALSSFVAGFGTVEPVLAAFVTQRAPTELRGTASGLYLQSQFLGAFAGGTLTGVLLDRGMWVPFTLFAAAALVWALLLGGLGRRPG